MSCASGSAFFRQLDTVMVDSEDTDLHLVPITVPLIPWSWWKVGKRLVFEVPAKGNLQSDMTIGIRLRDNVFNLNFVIGSLVILAGTELNSFRLVCDVSEIDNSTVTLKCWIAYPFPIGLGTPIFSEVSFNTSFKPLEVQLFWQNADPVLNEITFQNIQFTGLGKSSPLVC